MVNSRKLLLLLVIWLAGLAGAMAQESQNWTWGGAIDPLQKQYKVLHYTLDLEILPKTRAINGSLEMTFKKEGPLDTLRMNLIDRYKVLKVEMDGEEMAFAHKKDVLDVYPKGSTAEKVKVYYRGRTPIAANPPWTGGFTWEKDTHGNHWMGLSSQNEGAKIFMPCLDHPSSEPAEGVDLFFKVPFPYFVAANGRLVKEETRMDYNYFHWSTDYPINNYNINFTLGRLHREEKKYISVKDREIPMVAYVLEENKDLAPMLLAVLENSVRTQEKYFGEFPFPEDKIAVVETPYLGMEHQTINGYGNNFQFVRMGDVYYDWLLHHELGHEWWGNKVSVGDWADFWIHEGICSYGDWLFYLEHGGEKAYHDHAQDVAKSIRHEKPVAFAPNTTSDDAYHAEIYSKGAYILHSLRYILGDKKFFPMLKDFVEDPAYTYSNLVDTKDFTDFVQEYTRMDLRRFFELYLYSTDVPKIKIRKRSRNRYDISMDQGELVLPVEVETSGGIEKIMLSSEPTTVRSTSQVRVDPKGWYLLRKSY